MIVCLTGGIGSGKSTVARIFEMLGCAVFNSDTAAKEAYYEPGVRKAVENVLGQSAYRSNGTVDTAYIGSKAFKDEALLKSLNAIIHPAVKTMFEAFVAENAGRIIIKESALIFEAGIAGQCDKIITVVADDDLRIRRVMQRDGVNETEVRERMKRQWLQEEKVSKSDFVIRNNESDLVIPQILELLNKISAVQELK